MMVRLLLILAIWGSLLSQSKLIVYSEQSNSMNSFLDKELFKNFLDVYNSNNLKQLRSTFIALKSEHLEENLLLNNQSAVIIGHKLKDVSKFNIYQINVKNSDICLIYKKDKQNYLSKKKYTKIGFINNSQEYLTIKKLSYKYKIIAVVLNSEEEKINYLNNNKIDFAVSTENNIRNTSSILSLKFIQEALRVYINKNSEIDKYFKTFFNKQRLWQNHLSSDLVSKL